MKCNASALFALLYIQYIFFYNVNLHCSLISQDESGNANTNFACLIASTTNLLV